MAWPIPLSATGWRESIAIGLVFGSMFGQTTLASTATTFVPAPLMLRVPASLLWILLLAVGLAINVALNGGRRDMSVVFGALLFGQWLMFQLVVWSIRFAFGIKLSDFQDEPSTRDPSQHQFGIRQLMIVTALVGVLLGIGRLLMPSLIVAFPSRDLPVLVFLVMAEVVLTLPLVLAALLRRFALAGVLLALAFVACVTFGEVPVLRLLIGSPGPETSDFVALNTVLHFRRSSISVVI